MVHLKDADFPVINIDSVAIILNHLGVEVRRSTHGGEIRHGFDPPIENHMARWSSMDHPVSGYTMMGN